jgi:hypothetical protein
VEEGRVIDFDRAKYAANEGDASASTAPCAHCKQPIEDEYWKVQTQAVCKPCRDKVADLVSRSGSGKSLRKAAFEGGLVALGCGIAYAIFVGVTNIQIAFATIGIAVVVARVVRKASGGLGGRRFQVLAVALTYLASTMGYVPPIFKGLKEGANKPSHAQVAHEKQGADVGANAAAPAEAEPPKQNPFVALVMAVGILLGIMLAAPFLEITDSPLGLVIVAIGLWQAWKLTREAHIAIEGPFHLAPRVQALPSPGS